MELRKKQRTAVIIIGVVILIIIATLWTNELSKVKVGGPSTIGKWGRASPEEVAEKRATLNTIYGIWFVLVLAGTAALAYVLRPKQEDKDKSLVTEEKPQDKEKQKSDEEKQKLQAEIAGLKAKLKELDEKTKD